MKKYNEIQLTKNKMKLNDLKLNLIHPPIIGMFNSGHNIDY